ncbi:MAG: preprotein translocase subunit YajC [Micavibrio aeruginosavorus]|uniref:Sec translocon accessory complex subunit YajC n=1 Tax=Micavibrio aeruginosavorus TaxID=349221 RepID=A0A2W5FK68_9BACT|nr:MAG: preprotein translocase subunit YajC [Micavibrio aeruginosavorus]
MFIKSAFAASETATEATTAAVPAAAATPGAAFPQTIMFTVVLVILFYFLLIRPQQKRYKEHSDMLGKLGVGDTVVTQGGAIGKIDSMSSEKEVIVDFGNNIKMTVLRSSVMGKYETESKKTDKKTDKK